MMAVDFSFNNSLQLGITLVSGWVDREQLVDAWQYSQSNNVDLNKRDLLVYCFQDARFSVEIAVDAIELTHMYSRRYSPSEPEWIAKRAVICSGNQMSSSLQVFTIILENGKRINREFQYFCELPQACDWLGRDVVAVRSVLEGIAQETQDTVF